VWVRLTSSRIWRGSLDTKNWKYCSSKNGAWKPKAPAGAKRVSSSKGRGGAGRKRKAAAEPQGRFFSCDEQVTNHQHAIPLDNGVQICGCMCIGLSSALER